MAKEKYNFDIPDDYKADLGITDEDESEQEPEPIKREPATEEEKRTIDEILGDGVTFYCPTIYGRLWGTKKRKFVIKYKCTRTLIRLCREFVKLDFDMADVRKYQDREVKNLVVKHGETLCKIVAIAVVGNMPFAFIFRKLAYWYFGNRITPTELLSMSQIIYAQSDYANFLGSIVSMSGQRLTEPAPIDESNAG